MRGTSTTTLETSRIQELRSQMSIDPARARVPARLGQFLPDKRELWVDYLTPADRRFRLRFNLTADGEQLRFLDFQERPFKRELSTPQVRLSSCCSPTRRSLRHATRWSSSPT